MFVIVGTNGKRTRHIDGKITPCFEYPIQAKRYIEKKLMGSKNLKWKKVENE